EPVAGGGADQPGDGGAPGVVSEPVHHVIRFIPAAGRRQRCGHWRHRRRDWRRAYPGDNGPHRAVDAQLYTNLYFWRISVPYRSGDRTDADTKAETGRLELRLKSAPSDILEGKTLRHDQRTNSAACA